MKITSRFIGSTIIEVTVSTNDTSLTEDVCDLNGLVEQDFIDILKELVEDLELHNKKLNS
tara:strand:- start:346 stop:525 length:180 start_codon:yes stop_codon:yes gene_type:complete